MFNDLKKLLTCKLQSGGQSEAINRGQKLGNNVNVLQLWLDNRNVLDWKYRITSLFSWMCLMILMNISKVLLILLCQRCN